MEHRLTAGPGPRRAPHKGQGLLGRRGWLAGNTIAVAPTAPAAAGPDNAPMRGQSMRNHPGSMRHVGAASQIFGSQKSASAGISRHRASVEATPPWVATNARPFTSNTFTNGLPQPPADEGCRTCLTGSGRAGHVRAKACLARWRLPPALWFSMRQRPSRRMARSRPARAISRRIPRPEHLYPDTFIVYGRLGATAQSSDPGSSAHSGDRRARRLIFPVRGSVREYKDDTRLPARVNCMSGHGRAICA